MAGVNQPTKVRVENGHAYVTFASSFDANLAFQSNISYDSGNPMDIQTVEQFRQTKI